MASQSPGVLIYTNNILASSETFIRNPPRYFNHYRPIFIGSYRINGLDMSGEQVFTANGTGFLGRVQQAIRLRLFNDFGIARLAGKLNLFNPVILQAHFGHAAVHAMGLARKLRLPLIAYYHGLDATITDERAGQSLYFRPYLKHRLELQKQANLFLTQSDFLGQQLIDKGFPQEKIRTQYVGVDTSNVRRVALSEREPIVLFVARLAAKKGASYLIEAMSVIQKQYPQIKLVMVGDGPLRSDLERQAQEMLPNFCFVGWQTPDEVSQWMQKARVFCVPSVTAKTGDSEGFGMVFIEAQRWGTPVASFSHGGIVEAVAHEQTGLLAPERDTAMLTSYLVRLIEDDALWEKFSQTAYERVKQEFDMQKLVHKLETIYDELLDKS